MAVDNEKIIGIVKVHADLPDSSIVKVIQDYSEITSRLNGDALVVIDLEDIHKIISNEKRALFKDTYKNNSPLAIGENGFPKVLFRSDPKNPLY